MQLLTFCDKCKAQCGSLVVVAQSRDHQYRFCPSCASKTSELEKEVLTHILNYSNFPAHVMRALSVVNFDWENVAFSFRNEYYGRILGEQKADGVAFFGIEANGDWEYPVYMVFFYDKNHTLQAYIPSNGNVWNQMNNSAYGNGEDDEPNIDLIDINRRTGKDYDDYEDAELELDGFIDEKAIIQEVVNHIKNNEKDTNGSSN